MNFQARPSLAQNLGPPGIRSRFDEYRTMADECLRWAREVETKKERLMYLNPAKVWLELALRQDAQASSPRLPPTPRLKGVIRGLIVTKREREGIGLWPRSKT